MLLMFLEIFKSVFVTNVRQLRQAGLFGQNFLSFYLILYALIRRELADQMLFYAEMVNKIEESSFNSEIQQIM